MAAIPIEQQKEIIGRIKQLIILLGINQYTFANRIGIDPTNMSKHLSGRIPITQGLINRICLDYGISRLWLTTGEDVPFGKGEADHARQIDGGATNRSGRGVPVYNVDVTAGFGPLENLFVPERITGYMELPQLGNSGQERIVGVSGNSMEPGITSGSMLAIREVQSDTIFWGQIYVVVLEDYRMVKIVRKHADPQKVILHSTNPQYDDIEVNRSDIRGMYLVDLVINIA